MEVFPKAVSNGCLFLMGDLSMAKEYSKPFYNSSAWRKLSDYIRESRNHTCEECGEFASQVHHVIEITPSNINNTSITLNEDNLQLLCEDCHNKKRKKEEDINKGLKFDVNGDLVPKDTPLFK